MQDEEIGGRYSSFIPGPCSSQHSELTLFQCIACQGVGIEYTIKSEATKTYAQRITKLMEIQNSVTTIQRKFSDDLINDRFPNGYVKVCASWAKRMWNLDPSASAVLLGQPTDLFDNCGAYDFKNDGSPIDKSSTFADWSDALKYLEWYGIPHMDGFGIIFIDDQNQNKYI